MNLLFTPVIMLFMADQWFVSDGAYYTAGVVEYSPETLQPPETPPQLILRNARNYVNIISTAAEHGVDILVFPECGLTSIKVPVVRDLIVPYLTEISEIGSNPCDLPDAPKVLRTLSCAARSNKIYVVVNLEELAHCSREQAGCPSDGNLYYNTQIALNRNGNIVARYRKYNLFLEPEFNITQSPDHSWFETDFGVKFGMFICFDILFKEPTFELLSKQNISNFVYSTAWFSEMPFLFATPVQAAWAYANDVNLLSSGYSNTSNMNTGSGIYAGRDGPLSVVMLQQSSTRLLVARVSSDQRGVTPTHTEEITFSKDNLKQLNHFHYNISDFTSLLVTDKTSNLVYEKGGFKCNVSVDVSSLEDDVYRLVAHSGERSYALVRTTKIEVCGVIACADTDLTSCGYKPSQTKTVFNRISISASSKNWLLSYPITMTNELIPMPSNTFQFDHSQSDGEITMSMYTKTPLNEFITFALFRNG